MKTKPILLFVGSLVIALYSCDRTVDFIPPTETESVTEVFQDQELTVYEFRVEAEVGDTLVLEDNSGFAPTILVIPEDLCTYGNGEPCQGELEVQLIQAFTKGDMIFSNIPTSSGGVPLISGGAFYLNITQNEQRIQVSPDASFLIKAAVERTNGQNEDMMFYRLISDTVGTVVQNDWTLEGELAAIDEEYYTLQSDALNQWINIDLPVDDVLVTFTIKITIDQLEIDNADVYVALSDFNSVLKAEYDEQDGFYKTDVPLGAELEVVAFKKEGEEWFLDIHQAQETEQLSTLELELVLYDDLVDKLKTL